MKKNITIMLTFISLYISAQTTRDNSLKLDDIRLTNAPAFSLLDLSPSSIEKPSSTKAFSTSIVSNLNNGVPQNFALEITPFWFIKHPTLTAAKYFGLRDSPMQDSSSILPKDSKEKLNKTNANKGPSFNKFYRLQYVGLSLAVVNKDSTTNIGTIANHNISFGIRTNVIRIFSKQDRIDILTKTNAWLNDLNTKSPDKPGTSTDDFEKATQKSVDTLQTSLKAQPIFSIDFAAATNMAFQTNAANSNRISRTGVWFDFNYSAKLNEHKTNYFNLSGIVRYINDRDSLNIQKQFITVNYFDFGLKAEFQIQNLSLAYEYIKRITSSNNIVSSFRSAGIIQYKVSKSIYLTGSFGRNFSNGNNLITALGLNWGISNGTEKVEN